MMSTIAATTVDPDFIEGMQQAFPSATGLTVTTPPKTSAQFNIVVVTDPSTN
jgi:hypothetical protein